MAQQDTRRASTAQILIGVGVLILGGLVALGALNIRSETGYTGVGAAFLPWLVAAAFGVCGVNLVYSALSGGFRNLEDSTEGERPNWACAAWVSAGLLLNAALITTVGFVLSCTLLFILASRGFRNSLGQAPSGGQWARDALIGLCLSAPTYWVFTKGLGLTLPGLTTTGWL
jgi:putative tricarboxylic transport membrane protein